MNLLSIGRRFLCAASVVAMSATVNSCFDDSALKESIDDLNNRVGALEDFRNQVQSEIADLQEIIASLQAKVTVDDVIDNGDGSYTIRFSDGTNVTICDGQDGQDGQNGQDGQDGQDGEDGKDGLTPPEITVIEDNGEYYWGRQYPDGSTDFILDDNGNKIPVTADAPQVRINKDTGTWEISLDGGLTWSDTGMPSVGIGDSLFLSVEMDDEYVYLTLRDGTVITLPRTMELIFEFVDADDVITLVPGQKAELGFRMSGQKSVTVSKPDGWRAAIEGDKFVITAPDAGNIYAETEGIVSVIVISANGQSFLAEQKVKVYVSGELSVDLWKSTASFYYSQAGSDTKLYYKVKEASEWSEVSGQNGLFEIVPTWNKSKNAAGLDIYSLEEGTGVFAGKTYEFELRNGEEVIYSDEFTTEAGDKIPNGDMSNWSMKSGNIPYPNAEGESFWDSGNNSLSVMFGGSHLCIEDPENPGVAYMSAKMVLGSVFAPGNMYVGDFTMDGAMGTASFGKIYDWTARPKGLSVSYKANVGAIDKIGTSDPVGSLLSGKQDTTRIYAVVIDWSKQHGVTSGMGDPTGMWDPATATSLEEGAIIGYAMLDITASQADFTTVDIPFVWYDTEAKPAEGNYSVIISCATSKRGDYLTGCSTNELWVDNFEWVY